MQEKLLYEYAVIRLVPRVEREEFINLGIIIYCKANATLEAKYIFNKTKIQQLFPAFDLENLEEYLLTWKRICEGGITAGPIGQLPIASRFRWLTATRSTIVQTSKSTPRL